MKRESINIPFGFNRIVIGSSNVYCGKIRVKTDQPEYLIESVTTKSYGLITAYITNSNMVLMEFVVTNPKYNTALIELINKHLYSIMKNRLDNKYNF